MGLPENLKKAIDDRGLNPKQVSLAAGQGETWARDIITRRKSACPNPRVYDLRRVAAVLGLKLYDLIGEEAVARPKVRGRFVEDTDLLGWLEIAEALSAEDRVRANQIIRAAFLPPSEKAG